MALVKTSISIPEDIMAEAKEITDNFSSLVSDALREYLRKKNVEKAVASFGKWQEREKASVDIVKEIRKDKGRKYADRNR
jgi:predicted CopG family antitoxin